MVDVDSAGVPGYRFYLADTAAAAIGPEQAIVPADTIALHIGSLGLVMEPIGTSLEALLAGLPAGITVMLDPNCRPDAIASRQAYLDRIGRILARVDVIKTSTEDLSYLFPGQDTEYATAQLLGQGPACVVVTDGAAPERIAEILRRNGKATNRWQFRQLLRSRHPRRRGGRQNQRSQAGHARNPGRSALTGDDLRV